MVDGVFAEGPEGEQVWEPRPEEELNAISELVQSAVGYREDRGDVVTVRSLQFEAPVPEGIEAPETPFLTGAQLVRLLTVAALAIVATGVMAFVIRPLLLAAAKPEPDGATTPALPDSPGAEFGALAAPSASPPESEGLAALDAGSTDELPSLSDLPSLDSMDFGEPDAGEEDPVERLRQLISDRRDETLDVLKGWIEEDSNREGAT
jgi:flagellar M-ring protein FliF